MPARPYVPLSSPFVNRGWVSKISPSSLQDGQYQILKNMVSRQEASISVRNGSQRLLTNPSPIGVYIHSMAQLRTGDDPTENYRYLGEGDEIYRGDSTDTATFTDITPFGLTGAALNKRWQAVTFRKDAAGIAMEFFATKGIMAKDPIEANFGQALGDVQHWGIDAPVRPILDAQVGGAGNLDGNYHWVYTLRNPKTGHEGNPCAIMASTVNCSTQDANIVVWGLAPAPQTDFLDTGYYDPQCFGPQSITVYRAGGGVAPPDDVYRFVGYSQTTAGSVDTNGTAVTRVAGSAFDPAWATTFTNLEIIISGVIYHIASVTDTDNLVLVEDAGVQNDATFIAGTIFNDNVLNAVNWANRPVEYDNFPPVIGSLEIPLRGSILGFRAGTGAAGYNEVYLQVDQGLPAGMVDISQVLRPGTTLIFDRNNPEFVVIQAIISHIDPAHPNLVPSPNNLIAVYFAVSHGVNTTVDADSVVNQPCDLATVAYNSVFLAGDVNNRNVIYRSKTGRPEAFNVVNLTSGALGQMEVAPPGDDIMALVEANGDVYCLCKKHIYLVSMWNNQMQTAIVTPANRGLIAQNGWCKADNEIWFMAYDGIYSFAGGSVTKRSEAIDPLFRRETYNGMRPISFATDPLDPIQDDINNIFFWYENNRINVCYHDVDGNTCRLRYDTLYDRWWAESEASDDITGTPDPAHPPALGSALFEADTGTILVGKSIWDPVSAGWGGYLIKEDQGTSDNWRVAGTDGAAIDFDVWTPYFNGQQPTLQKQWGDVILELDNSPDPITGTGATVTVNVYYDFSTTPDPVDVFTITAAAGRRRVPLPLKSAYAQEAAACAFRFTGSATTSLTLYSLTFNVLLLEHIQRGRAYDWDDLGYQHDKRLTNLSVEFDTKGNDVTLHMDTQTGVIGAVSNNMNVQSFTLSSAAAVYPPTAGATGPVRARATFTINDATIVKAIRMRPDPTAYDYLQFEYKFDFIPYPPDSIAATEWEDLGWPCEKIVRELVLEVDTGGVPADVMVQADTEYITDMLSPDGRAMVETDYFDRHRILSFTREFTGRNWRILPTPGAGGKFQLFKHTFNSTVEPCRVQHWASGEQAFAYNGFKCLKQIWVEYVSCDKIWFSIYTDNRTLFYKIRLPWHPHRDVERFYVPAVWSPVHNIPVLNKSRVYNFEIDSCNPCCGFKMYWDSTVVEVMPLSGDQRQAYSQQHLWEPQPIPAV